MVTYTRKQFLLICLGGLILAVILGALARTLFGLEGATPYAEQAPVDGLVGLMVMLLGLALYYPVHLFRHLRRSK